MFDRKAWIDAHVIPWLKPTRLSLYSVFWNQAAPDKPPSDVLVFVRAGILPPPAPPVDNDNQVDEDDIWAEVARAASAEQQATAAAIEPPTALDPAAFPVALKQLLDIGFKFDFLRDVQMVMTDQGMVPIFGGDGTPVPRKDGHAYARLYRQLDRTNLLVELGAKYSEGKDAIAAIKAFYALYSESPMQVAQKFAVSFGAA